MILPGRSGPLSASNFSDPIFLTLILATLLRISGFGFQARPGFGTLPVFGDGSRPGF
jgi:hypothetical protein